MGNCGSDEIRFAISQDGQDNVKKASILTANQQFIENFVNSLKPTYERQFKKKTQLKESQISDARKIINTKFQQKKIALQTQEPGTVEYLASKNNKSFEALSGYADAVTKIDQFQKRMKQIYTAEGKALFDNMDKFKDNAKFELQKAKPALTALMGLGLAQKDQVLKVMAQKHQDQVDQSNKKIQEHTKSEYRFQQGYRKRCEQWVPKSQLDGIVVQFQENLKKIGTKKSKNGFLGCF